MRLDPKLEKPTRDLLSHVIRGEWEEFGKVATAIPEERLAECVSLCLRIAGYIAIDVCGQVWPSEADLREIAQRMASMEDMEYDLNEEDIFACLSRSALGFEPLIDVFTDTQKMVGVPFTATATLLVAYRPDGTDWWDYLEQIEQALEIATDLPEAVVPALLLLTRRQRALKSGTAHPNADE